MTEAAAAAVAQTQNAETAKSAIVAIRFNFDIALSQPHASRSLASCAGRAFAPPFADSSAAEGAAHDRQNRAREKTQYFQHVCAHKNMFLADKYPLRLLFNRKRWKRITKVEEAAFVGLRLRAFPAAASNERSMASVDGIRAANAQETSSSNPSVDWHAIPPNCASIAVAFIWVLLCVLYCHDYVRVFFASSGSGRYKSRALNDRANKPIALSAG